MDKGKLTLKEEVTFEEGCKTHGNKWLKLQKVVVTRNYDNVVYYSKGCFERVDAGKPGILNRIHNSDPSSAQTTNLLLLLLNGRLF